METRKLSAVASAYIEVLKKSSESLDAKKKNLSVSQSLETVRSFETKKQEAYDIGQDEKELIPLAKSASPKDVKSALRNLIKTQGYKGFYNSKSENPNKIIKLEE